MLSWKEVVKEIEDLLNRLWSINNVLLLHGNSEVQGNAMPTPFYLQDFK